jgi:hypothetical protein
LALVTALNRDGERIESNVPLVEAETVEEKEREMGRMLEALAGEVEVDGLESRKDAGSRVKTCGRGSRGGSGGIGKLTIGPRVTCLKYVVR